jgi:hypothetical protein
MDEDVNRPREESASPPDANSMERPALRRPGSQEVRIGALVALAVLAGLVVWLLVRDDSTPTSSSSATAASAQDLAELPATVGHPVYWAGPRRGFTYELTRTSDGRIYIRYLPAGVSIGSNQPKYLTVGTYPSKNALAVVRGVAKGLRVKAMRLNGGGAAVQDTKHPTSVYLAYPRSDYQIEVYDPSPAHALQLALSGKITPLESKAGSTHATSGRPRAATLQQLRAVESSAGKAAYWVGPRPGTTYELTETGDGKVYVRYLPRGTKVGDPKPHTTVGTYPFRNPVAAVEAIAKETGGQTFSIAGGGLAAVDGNHPTSVYVAFPRSNYQIEVFDPSAPRARGLVSSGRVVAVR